MVSCDPRARALHRWEGVLTLCAAIRTFPVCVSASTQIEPYVYRTCACVSRVSPNEGRCYTLEANARFVKFSRAALFGGGRYSFVKFIPTTLRWPIEGALIGRPALRLGTHLHAHLLYSCTRRLVRRTRGVQWQYRQLGVGCYRGLALICTHRHTRRESS